MAIELSPKEYLEFCKFKKDKVNFWVSNKDKILVFHGYKDGSTNMKKYILFYYYLIGYSFICCYSKRVKNKLKFGKYIYKNLDDKITQIDLNKFGKVFIAPMNLENYHLYSSD